MLNKYYKFEPEDLNTKFESSFMFMDYVLKKYNISNGSIEDFADNNFYKLKGTPLIFQWKRENKVPSKLWNLLHKNLILLYLTGKIKETMTLEELEEEFNFLSHK